MKRPDIALLAASAGLTGLGLVMLATWQYAHFPGGAEYPEAPNALAEQAIGAAAGWLLLWAASRVDYRCWQRVALPLFAMVLVLLFGNWIPSTGLGPSPHRMISIDVFAHVQPAVIAGGAIILFLAWWYGARRPSHLGWVPFAALSGMLIGLIATLNFGAAAWIFLTAGIIMILGGVKTIHVMLYGLCVLNGIMWIIIRCPVRVGRLMVFFAGDDPQRYCRPPHGMALDTGGWTGAGLGNGNWSASGFPMTAGNWAAAHIGEELGWLGLLAMNALYVVVLTSGFMISAKASTRFGRLLGTGIVSLVAISVLLNMAGLKVASPILLPALPLVSYGGFGLCLNLMAVGVLVNLARRSRETSGSQREEGMMNHTAFKRSMTTSLKGVRGHLFMDISTSMWTFCWMKRA